MTQIIQIKLNNYQMDQTNSKRKKNLRLKKITHNKFNRYCNQINNINKNNQVLKMQFKLKINNFVKYYDLKN